MTSFKKKRADLRRRLQDQRRRLAAHEVALEQELRTPERGLATLLAPRDTFPRSVTMRLLTNPQNFILMAVAELLPVLLRHFLNNAERNQQFDDR